MKSLKFIHCADSHLDAPFREYGAGGYAETRRNDIRKAFTAIIKAVKQENADFLLISGDLYEHRYVTRRTLEWLNMLLSDIQVPVVLIPGNHDPALGNSWYRTWDWPSHVHILTPDHPSLLLEEQEVFFHGLGFSTYKEDKPDLLKVPKPVKDYFNILLFHGTLDMSFSGEAYHPAESSELESLGYDYYALGHFHNIRTDYPLKNAVNPGSPEPLGFDEPGKHGAFLVTVQVNQGSFLMETQKIETAVRVYHHKKLDITGCKTMEEVKLKLLGAMEGLDPQRDITLITLKGRTSLVPDAKALTALLSENWLYLEIRNEAEKDFDSELLDKDQTLKGVFYRVIQKRLHEIETALDLDSGRQDLMDEQERLKLSLQFGLEALYNGKIEWWDEDSL